MKKLSTEIKDSVSLHGYLNESYFAVSLNVVRENIELPEVFRVDDNVDFHSRLDQKNNLGFAFYDIYRLVNLYIYNMNLISMSAMKKGIYVTKHRVS